jgi:hypothetical protein
MNALPQALLAAGAGAHWTPPGRASLATRQRVDAAIGALLETLSAVPDLLEVPPAREPR